MGRETENLVYGSTSNVFDPELTSGGSSGGDGSLVASGAVAFGVGTDIGGSSRYPAVFNGIVGFKPASGQTDKVGIFPMAGNDFVETLNSPGILSRTVRDARLAYNVIGDKQLEYNEDISDMKMYTCNSFRVTIKDDSIAKALNASVEFFKKGNNTLKDVDIPESGTHCIDFASLMTGGFKDKIFEWSVTEDGRRLTFVGELFRRLLGKPTISNELFAMLLPFSLFKPSASKFQKLVSRVEEGRMRYHTMLQNGVLILPTVGILAPKQKKFWPQYNKPGVIGIIAPVSFYNVYNLSCITIPAWRFQKNGSVNPPGIQLVTAPGNEAQLLNSAQKLEAFLANK